MWIEEKCVCDVYGYNLYMNLNGCFQWMHLIYDHLYTAAAFKKIYGDQDDGDGVVGGTGQELLNSRLIELSKIYDADFSDYERTCLIDQLLLFIVEVRNDDGFRDCNDLGHQIWLKLIDIYVQLKE
ncbi:hypothetical protein ACJX0J_015172 [Zea mays]